MHGLMREFEDCYGCDGSVAFEWDSYGEAWYAAEIILVMPSGKTRVLKRRYGGDGQTPQFHTWEQRLCERFADDLEEEAAALFGYEPPEVTYCTPSRF